jgi:hypothetical protein
MLDVYATVLFYSYRRHIITQLTSCTDFTHAFLLVVISHMHSYWSLYPRPRILFASLISVLVFFGCFTLQALEIIFSFFKSSEPVLRRGWRGGTGEERWGPFTWNRAEWGALSDNMSWERVLQRGGEGYSSRVINTSRKFFCIKVNLFSVSYCMINETVNSGSCSTCYIYMTGWS